ncbi:MAG: DUF4965 domain-containing protein [Trueperaceae bacterium]|nr:DUF4965 domain-containing protein [Trueperaceae bacterium]
MQRNKLRPPAVPLIVNDPYLSIWSMADTLTDQPTKHWTGKVQALSGLIAIDGQAYRFMGSKPNHFELNVPNMEQIDLQVLPTRTIYTFEAAGVRLELTFLTPLLPHNLELMSRPVSYLDFSLSSTDQQSHKVQLYLDISPALCVDHPMQEVVWGRHRIAGQEVLWMGSKDQAMLKRSGDDLRIEWGYLYATPLETAGTSSVFASSLAAQTHFAKTGDLLDQDDTDMPKQPGNRPGAPVAAWLIEVGNVSETPQAKAFLLAYDDYYSIEYFQRKLKPYWRKDGANAASLIRLAINDYKDIKETCEAYDEELTQDLKTAGGNVYVSLGSLAFRQCIAAHKLVVDGDGEALFFSKENYSNGCMGTVDITYPSSPFFLLFNPDLLKAQVTPILDYVRSGRWPFPFAPHDIGRYPIANGQFYGGGENSEIDQMPVEECGNMLILVAALYKAKSDQSFLERYWQILSNWADYLLAKGLDPENQLCTDDFAGHMAHNVNLSLKALLGIAAYAQLCDAIGETQKAQEIRAQVQHMTKQ